MRSLLTSCFLTVLVVLYSGCSSAERSVAIPPGLNRSAVPNRTVEMTAERFRFVPDTVRVKAGTLVRIDLKSIDGTHGFGLSAFGIDEEVSEGETKSIEFYASGRGQYTFHCSHFCGIGHFGMKGTLIVE